MNLVMILGLILGIVVVSAGQSVKIQEEMNVKEKANSLQLSISSVKRTYKQHDKIKITLMLTNDDYVKDIFIYGTLGWGYYSSFTDTIRDASGRPVRPKNFPDELTPPIDQNDTSSFVKLRPRHFLGTYFVEQLDELNIGKPGKYSIFVEYHSPISKTDVSLSNVWSKEDGTIRSNTVWIEIVP